VTVPTDRAEEARARLLELFPEGFEETAAVEAIELAAYTDGVGEEHLRAEFADVSSRPVEPGWEDRWRSFHRPVRIGPLWVGPPWEDPPSDALAVVVDPGRAFGTGAHPTTRLTLELLLELERGSFLDVGCGSGVLAIAAAKVGFGPVRAVDVDPVAVEATEKNAARNGVAVQAAVADARHDPLAASDAAVANIALDVVEAAVAQLEAAAVITSGYLDDQRPTLARFAHAARRTRDGWAADLFRAK
jgi:ribosomal protein L11 methyltransferase